MNKFFVTERTYTRTYGLCGSLWGTEVSFTHALSFCRLENARRFARKLEERTSTMEGEVEVVTVTYGQVYGVEVPSSWSSADVARWLDEQECLPDPVV